MDWRLFLADRSPIDPVGVTPTRFITSLFYVGETAVIVPGYQNCRGWPIFLDGSPDCPSVDALATGQLDVWFLSQPTDGQWRPRPDGGTTCRSEANVTAWRHLVLESDILPAGVWLAWLAIVPAAIRAIYTSGGSSIHALVRIDAKSKSDWDVTVRAWKPILTRLGADPKCLTAVRLTRLPGCRRESTGRWQELLWLDPEADGKPINTKPQVRRLVEPF